ncbi:hypothetical protein P5673_023273, partial [Acropora cervicornis]
ESLASKSLFVCLLCDEESKGKQRRHKVKKKR